MHTPRLSRVLPWLAALPLLAIDDPVRVTTGLLSGAGTDVRAYKGIPFAAPPVGDLRWKGPRPPAAWEGTRQATEYSASCMQLPYPQTSLYYSPPAPTSEDCLYLNVWTGAKSARERRPVMVWIHGGALTRGSGASSWYDGEELARKGVVLVTINYRLGVFGFFAHPELTKESDRNASGNYGLLDQITALEWVQKNIAAFGGDPGRVTIFGESAGSWSVNYLVASPLAHGLFHRAIGESGAAFNNMPKLAEAEQAGVSFASSVGADSLTALRGKPAEELLKASATAAARSNVDGWSLPQDVYSIFAAGKQNDVPLIAGFNADEGKSLTVWPGGTAASYTALARRRFPNLADEFLKAYPVASDDDARNAFFAVFRDQLFGWNMRTWVRMANKTGKSKSYLYYFTRVPPGPRSDYYGAYHAAEIPYVFHNLDRVKRPWEDTDRKLSAALASYWVNFAVTGNPNGKGLVKWPVYIEKADAALELGDGIRTRENVNKPGLDFFDAWFRSQRAGN